MREKTKSSANFVAPIMKNMEHLRSDSKFAESQRSMPGGPPSKAFLAKGQIQMKGPLPVSRSKKARV